MRAPPLTTRMLAFQQANIFSRAYLKKHPGAVIEAGILPDREDLVLVLQVGGREINRISASTGEVAGMDIGFVLVAKE